MILGISGPNGAGKGEAVEFLRARSFYALSLSDVIRGDLRERGVDETRERMIDAGRALRAAGGPGVLAERLARQLLPDRNYVIDSIRHPAEVDVLRRSSPSFRLVWVDAPAATRLARMCARGRGGDPVTLEDLARLEGRERGSADIAAQQLDAVQALADFPIENAGSIEALHEALQQMLSKCLHFERPGWDEYFLSVALMVASRSNCVKRKVGAVIARDRRIISTGYNGTPRGVRNCNEGGCPRCNAFAIGGTKLDECLCSHAEENSLIQAAYHGVAVREATLYTTLSPCLSCTKMILNAGIAEVVFNAEYGLAEASLSLLREAGLAVRRASVRIGPAI